MFSREIFAQRVHELRKQHNLTLAELAEKVGISRSSANNWELETRSPSVEVLALLADYFEVSADYLMGRTDKREMN